MFSDSNLSKILGVNYKWLYFLKFRFKISTTYKTDTFLWFFGELLKLLGIIFIWYLGSLNGSQINFPKIFTYLVIGRLIDSLTNVSDVFWFGSKLSKNTDDSVRVLMLPHGTNGVFLYLMTKYFGSNIFHSFVNIFWLVVLSLIFHSWILLPTNWLTLLWLPAFMILTLLIKFFINFCIGLFAVWTTESGGIWSLFGGINDFLSGSMFPLNLYFLTNWTLYLPFACTYFYPINLYFEPNPWNLFWIFGGGVFWTILLYFLARIILKAALKKNESVGL